MSFIEALRILLEIEIDFQHNSVLLHNIKEKISALLRKIVIKSNLGKVEKKEAKAFILQIVMSAQFSPGLDLELALIPYAKFAYLFEQNGIPEEHAHKLAFMFNSKIEALEYLIAFSEANHKVQVMHDGCGFVLPQGSPKDIEKWKALATKKQSGSIYPLLNQKFRKILGLSKDIVEFIKKENDKEKVKSCQNRLIENIKNTGLKKIDRKEKKENLFKSRFVFKINDKGVLVQEEIMLSSDVSEETNNTKILKMGLAHLETLLAAYAKLCDQYETRKTTLGKIIGEKQYLDALATLQVLRAKRAEFHLGQPFKQISIVQLFDYYEAYLQLNPDPIRTYFIEMGISEQKYMQFLKLDKTQAGMHIPDILLDGNNVGYPGFYLKKLNVNNENEAAIVATIGKLTRCCQSLSGEAGEPCVIHSLTNPDGGCYAIFKGDIQQSSQASIKELKEAFQCGMWVWRSKNKNALVFDSIEMIEKGVTETMVTLVRKAAHLLIQNEGIDRVHCGQHAGISSAVGKYEREAYLVETHKAIIPLQIERFKDDYSEYSDATSQYVLSDKDRPYYFLDRKGYCEIAVQWVIDILSSKCEPEDLIPLWKAINWACINHEYKLLEKLQGFSKTKGVIVKHMIDSLYEYIKHGLSPVIIEHIQNDRFYMESIGRAHRTPLMLAILADDIQLVKVCIAKKANLEHQDEDGETPFMLAVSKNNVDMVLVLGQEKVDFEKKSVRAGTALHRAVAYNQSKMVQALVQLNVNLNSKHGKYTPLMICIIYKYDELALLLINAGVDLGLMRDNGDTALEMAVQMGRTKVVEAITGENVNQDILQASNKTKVTVSASPVLPAFTQASAGRIAMQNNSKIENSRRPLKVE